MKPEPELITYERIYAVSSPSAHYETVDCSTIEECVDEVEQRLRNGKTSVSIHRHDREWIRP